MTQKCTATPAPNHHATASAASAACSTRNPEVGHCRRPEAGQPDAYPHLQLVLTKPIDWELVRQQYDQMIKYATRSGSARRRRKRSCAGSPGTTSNIQPTRHSPNSARQSRRSSCVDILHSEALRREINEGLNVIEQWNGANDFVFFARRGELVSNRSEDHEVSMLALHLLQNCMVYVNTLMLQRVLAQPKWAKNSTPRDLAALTPLIWEHVNPYGRFELDMNSWSLRSLPNRNSLRHLDRNSRKEGGAPPG